ncbi:MAG: 2TM domain-containing protein [Flavobacteriaceae bacterium]|nr:2TM domain-containing protein [Flavobacteriaceae bacterium]
MELVIMENNNDRKYRKARKRVKEIKDFYTHLIVYIIVNIFLIIMHLGIFQSGLANVEIPKWSMFITPFSWGIGLFFHWLKVFKDSFKFFKDWEDRKIQEYLDREEEELKRMRKS